MCLTTQLYFSSSMPQGSLGAMFTCCCAGAGVAQLNTANTGVLHKDVIQIAGTREPALPNQNTGANQLVRTQSFMSLPDW